MQSISVQPGNVYLKYQSLFSWSCKVIGAGTNSPD